METYGIEKYGLSTTGTIYRNIPAGSLVEKALLKKEGRLSRAGCLCIETGERTGRSPNDKYIVDHPSIHDKIAWGKVNRPVSPEKFDLVYQQIIDHLSDKDLYIFDGYAGANPKYSYAFRIINEKASQNLFISNLLIKPTPRELQHFQEDYLILAAPDCKIDKSVGLNSDVAVMIDYARQIVLIAGTGYSGEIKKSIFCVMNYVLPQRNVFTMHCSANIGDEGDTAYSITVLPTSNGKVIVTEQGSYCIYDVTLKNKNGTETKSMKFVMELGDGTDFKMSFSF